jgi:hypothetical protein
MILPFILVAIALISLLVIFYVARGQSRAVRSVDDLADQIRPVDMEAFRNLTDPDEERFLRDCLSREEFRVVHRERLRAAVEYVGTTAYNSTVLLRMGEGALRSSDPQVAAAGRNLVDTALRLRLYALLCMAKLHVTIILPNVPLSLGGLVDNYQRLRGMATQLALIQQPRHASQVSAIL